MEILIVLGGLWLLLFVLVRTWKSGRRKQAEAASRMHQDVRRYYDDLHKGPTRGLSGRSFGHNQRRR